MASLEKTIIQIRQTLEKSFSLLLKQCGISENGDNGKAIDGLENLREEISKIIDADEKQLGFSEAREKFIQEASFTTLNRLVGLKVMETRGLLDTTYITKNIETGGKSQSHYLYLSSHPEARNESGQGINSVLDNIFKELSKELPQLYDGSRYGFLPRGNDTMKVIDLLNSVPDEEWKKDDVIGWVYQYYNVEERRKLKDRNEKIDHGNIHFQSQQYTPRWVVKHIVDNTLGRYYLEMYPDSDIYEEIEIPVPKDKLKKEREEKPLEEIKILDPACGSGNFLLYSFELLYKMYKERNYEEDKISSSILKNNLHGIDIDDRSVQLTILSLYLKARTLDKPKEKYTMNVVSSDFMLSKSSELESVKNKYRNDTTVQDFIDLIWEQLKNAKYFGSLLDITGELEKLKKKRKESDTLFFDETKWEETEINVLEDIKNNVKNNKEYGEYIEQGMNFAELLIQKYDVVVANPPYIGSADMKKEYKDFVKDNYKGFDKNLYAAFIKRNADFVKRNGFVGMITPQTYMFISSYDKTRNWILEKNQIIDFVHYGLGGVFSEVLVDTSIIIFKKQKEENYESIFYNLVKFERSSKTSKKDALQNAVMELKNGKECKYVHFINQNEFKKIPDSPFVYWISKEIRELFSKYNQLNDYANIVVGLQTGDNDRFLHFWWEVDQKDISQNYEIDRKKWVPYAKGGPYNKWYGNLWWVVNWENDGEEIKELVDINGKQKSRPQNESYYFKEGLNFSQTTSSALSCRYSPKNTIFDVVSSSIFSKNLSPKYYLSIINSKTTNILANVVNPTVHYQVGDLKNISIPDHSKLENITIPANQSDLVNKLNNYKPLTNNQINLETIAKDCINIKKELYSFHIMERDYKNDPLSWAVNKLAENGEVISVKSALKEFFLHKAELETRLLLNEALNDELVFKAYELMPEEQTLENIVSENYVNNSSQDTSSDKGSISAVLEVLESEGIPPGAYPQRELTDKEKEKLRKLYINHRKDRGSGKSKAINGMDFGIVGELSARLRVNPVTIFNEIKKIEYLPEKAVKDVITEHIQALVIEIMRNDNDGIMSLSTDTGEKSLPTMIREKWRDLGLGDTYNELENLLGKTIDDYLFRDFFKDHAKRFMKRPIIWHLVSEKGSFNFFVRHHSWSHDRLLLLKSKYLGEVKRTLDNTLASETDEKKRNELMDELNELEKFDKKIDKLLSSEYDPKVDDGVAKNIAPLQKEEILKTNVLSKKQMNKMLNVKW